jgi:ArsR family transcriptional regulator, arsenate/arsenite/antimonite-responsive transcriptional repressor
MSTHRSVYTSKAIHRQTSIFCVTVPSMDIDVRRGEGTPAACCAPVNAPDLTDGEATSTAALFKALGDPHRIRIVNQLVNAPGPVCVCDLNRDVEVSQSTLSFHLKKLLDAGLLTREQRGVWAFYSIDRTAADRLRDVLLLEGADRR